MHCYVYASLRKPDTYVWMTRRDGFEMLPEPLVLLLGELRFVLEVELTPQRKLPHDDSDRVLTTWPLAAGTCRRRPTRHSPSATSPTSTGRSTRTLRSSAPDPAEYVHGYPARHGLTRGYRVTAVASVYSRAWPIPNVDDRR